jgi:hypothetical protein
MICYAAGRSRRTIVFCRLTVDQVDDIGSHGLPGSPLQFFGPGTEMVPNFSHPPAPAAQPLHQVRLRGWVGQ